MNETGQKIGHRLGVPIGSLLNYNLNNYIEQMDYWANGVNDVSLITEVGSGGSLKQLPSLSLNRATSDAVLIYDDNCLMLDATANYEYYLETIIESFEGNIAGYLIDTTGIVARGFDLRMYGAGMYLQVRDEFGTYVINQIAGNFFQIGLNKISVRFDMPTKVINVDINGHTYLATHDRTNVFNVAGNYSVLGQRNTNSKTQKAVYFKVSKNNVPVYEWNCGLVYKNKNVNSKYSQSILGNGVEAQLIYGGVLSLQDLANPIKNGYDLYWHEDTLKYKAISPINANGSSKNPAEWGNLEIIDYPKFATILQSDIGYHLINYVELPDLAIFDTTDRTYWKVSIESDPYYVGGTAGKERWFHREWLDFDWINSHIEDDYKYLFFVRLQWKKAIGQDSVKLKINDIVLFNEVVPVFTRRRDLYESEDFGRFYQSIAARDNDNNVFNPMYVNGDKVVAMFGNYLKYSSDGGKTYSAGFDFSTIYPVVNISYVRIMNNGNIVIFSKTTLLHYSDDNLQTVNLCTTLDINGDAMVFTSGGHYFLNLDTFVETESVAVFGNYPGYDVYPTTPNNQFSKPMLWQSFDGITWKVFYKFGTPNLLANHIHQVSIGYDNNIYVFTGDLSGSMQFVKCVYNAELDSWEIIRLTDDISSTWQRMRAIGGYERNGYIYWGSDGILSHEQSGVTYSGVGIFKSRVGELNDSSKHILLDRPVMDIPCLSFKSDNITGKIIAVFGDAPITISEILISTDCGETWEHVDNRFNNQLMALQPIDDGYQTIDSIVNSIL